ncbi:MAG: hypothetical protein BGO26_15575 [Actinobacteria bacterium 69-20]|jgi:lysophospholipase L1-like esterase|nr:SGNH/GDSL hydrolase family protein [Actinomycetota bacterium]OJV28733.1 MAG: hypothetical protein BGO26_15575 [Actinobacteria bacterium 69-20]
MTTMVDKKARAGGAGVSRRAARRGARLATRPAIGFGAVTAGLVGAVGASMLTLVHQAREASSTIETAALGAAAVRGLLVDGQPFDWQSLVLNGDGVYLPDGSGPQTTAPAGTRVLGVVGDSLSIGFGCITVDELPGVRMARGAAASLHRPVRLVTVGIAGSTTAELTGQVKRVLAEMPDAVVVTVGANDVLHRCTPRHAARELRTIVEELRARGVGVVVATCPDLGVVLPIGQPLRRIVGAWSRDLAKKQERVVTAAGGAPVALARLVSPAFYGHPDLFYVDHFHPSGQGYAKATAAILPAVIDALR